MQQAAPERSALIRQDLHPQAACCALFLDAILKDDWRLVRRAMKTLESMYDEELISPTEAGYVLCCVIPSNFRTVQSMDVPIGPDERLLYARFVAFVAEESFGDQPLAGSKAQLFFRTDGSVEWIANAQGSVYMIENYYLLLGLYFGVLKAASITLDFLDDKPPVPCAGARVFKEAKTVHDVEITDGLVTIDRKLHPQSAFYALLADAVWKGDWRLVRKAVKTLRQMYVDELISPMDAAYIFAAVFPANYASIKDVNIPIGPEARLPYIDFAKFVAREAFGDIPLKGSKAWLLTKATGPLEKNPMNHSDVMLPFLFYDFLVEVIESAGITMDLLRVILFVSTDPGASFPAKHASDSGIVGRKLLLDPEGPECLLELARIQPAEFVEIIHGYFKPLMDVVLRKSLELWPAPYGPRFHSFMAGLVRILAVLMAEGRIPESSRDLAGQIILLTPYLRYMRPDAAHRDLMNRMLQKALEEGWTGEPMRQAMCEAYESIFQRVLKDACKTDFIRAGRGRYQEELDRIAGLLDALILLDESSAVKAIAEITVEITSQRDGIYGQVRAATARGRIRDTLSRLVSLFPDRIVTICRWGGACDQLDKVIAKVLDEKVGVVV